MSLRPLRDIADADYPGSLDHRSWVVVARDGSELGTVAEVIVDVDTTSPAYLHIVPMDQEDSTPMECWICVPYRHVTIDEAERRVVMSDLALLGLGTSTLRVAAGRLR